jgi:hypothetical protein
MRARGRSLLPAWAVDDVLEHWPERCSCVSGPFTFQSTLGGAPVTHAVSTVVHWYKPSKKAHGKKGGRHQSS